MWVLICVVSVVGITLWRPHSKSDRNSSHRDSYQHHAMQSRSLRVLCWCSSYLRKSATAVIQATLTRDSEYFVHVYTITVHPCRLNNDSTAQHFWTSWFQKLVDLYTTHGSKTLSFIIRVSTVKHYNATGRRKLYCPSARWNTFVYYCL